MSENKGVLETRADVNSDKQHSVRYWKMEIASAASEEKEWHDYTDRLDKKYRGEDKTQFNIFWSNIETLKPTLYSATPRPDVRRKYRSKDPIGRAIAIALEEALSCLCEEYPFDDVIRAARDDRLIGGRGVIRLNYIAHLEEREDRYAEVNEMGELVEQINRYEEIADQTLELEYVYRKDFRMSPAKCWEEVRWVAFRHRPTRDELVDQFGEQGQHVPLTHSVVDSEKDEVDDIFKRAEVWEIWDKETLQRIWVSENFPKILEIEDDPYELEQFFPMPKPLYGIRSNGSMVPVPDYRIYEKQAAVVNQTTVRISKLTEQLKVSGLYASVEEEMQRLMTAKDGELIPVMQAGPGDKIEDKISFWPIEQIAKTLISLYQARDQAVQIVYQITGISDIVRGSSKASETATAQQIKGNFATIRMQTSQISVQEFVRDAFRLKAEIIANHFTAEKIAAITGEDLSEIEMALPILRDDKLRSYRIDIETDSTVQPDAESDKRNRIEFITAVTGFIEKVGPLAQSGLVPADVAKAMLSFAVRGFKVGRELEDALDAIGNESDAPQQPQAPSDEMIKAETRKVEIQADMLKQDKEQAFEAQQNAADRQVELLKVQPIGGVM